MKTVNPHNQNPFGIPPGYMEAIEDSVMLKIAEADLRELVPNSGFKMPQDYLSSIEPKVLSKLNPVKEKTPVITLFNKRNAIAALAIAACLLLIVTIFNSPTQTENVTLAQIETEDLTNFISSDAISFTDQELVAFYQDENIEFNAEPAQEDISQEDLEEYVLDYLDATDLLEQYEQ